MKEVKDNTKWHKTTHKEDRHLWVYFENLEGMQFAQENRKLWQACLYHTCDYLDNRTPEEEAVSADVCKFPKGIHIGGVMNDVLEAFQDMRTFMGGIIFKCKITKENCEMHQASDYQKPMFSKNGDQGKKEG